MVLENAPASSGLPLGFLWVFSWLPLHFGGGAQ